MTPTQRLLSGFPSSLQTGRGNRKLKSQRQSVNLSITAYIKLKGTFLQVWLTSYLKLK